MSLPSKKRSAFGSIGHRNPTRFGANDNDDEVRDRINLYSNLEKQHTNLSGDFRWFETGLFEIVLVRFIFFALFKFAWFLTLKGCFFVVLCCVVFLFCLFSFVLSKTACREELVIYLR